jgi:predicted acylesterase/phospholipase RssA
MNAPTTDESGAPKDRYCDLVMKGGITSGVVYPPAICVLAEHYRFKNIGGTSAGAIAAAVTAAAEYRRRTSGSMDGFTFVKQLPTELGNKDGTGDTQLLRLFQPDRTCRRPFRVLVGSLNAKGTFHRVGAVLWGCITSYWIASLSSLVLSSLVGLAFHSIHAWLLLLAMSLPAFVGLTIYRDLTRNVVGNNYGLCKGMTTNERAGPALTPWLHKLIQDAAGLPLDEPLTFGHLWNAPGGPVVQNYAPTGARSIDLRMFTTNLSHGRPYIFPHTEWTARLFYKPDELEAYLPAEVMRWINAKSLSYAPSSKVPGSDPKSGSEGDLREVPPADKFPILLAARMSLSFPMLFAAVPLWAIDYEYPPPERTFKRCLFSDGGISSNFPMHLFDGLIPQWPTFGIDLEDKVPGHSNMVFLPRRYLEGIADRWTRFDQATNSATKLGGFLMSIVGTMQNWNDNTLSRTPGVRDRVVRVRLNKDEGGMNLNMPKALIDRVAARGAEAAGEIIDSYLEQPPVGWDGWSNQRWVRLDVFISTLTQKISGMQRALGHSVPCSRPYEDLIADSAASAPPGHFSPLSPSQVLALKQLTTALDDVAKAFASSSPNYPNEPIPDAEQRVGPVL